MNLERVWKEALMSPFKAPFLQFPAGNEEKHKKTPRKAEVQTEIWTTAPPPRPKYKAGCMRVRTFYFVILHQVSL